MCHTKCFHALQILSRECCNVIDSIYTLVTKDLGGTKHWYIHVVIPIVLYFNPEACSYITDVLKDFE